MASIDSMTFDQPAYAPGQLITLTVAYTPDAAGVTPTPFTATTVITDSAGAQTATGSADFTVNEPAPGGDTLATTDTGSRSWAEASNSGTVAVFTATA
jgi:hypothetical protein